MLKGNFIYMGARNWTNDKGKMLTFAKIGNVEKMENYEFIIDVNKVDVSPLTLHCSIDPVFELGTYNGRAVLNLIDIKPQK